jgi:hypothetical protein
MSIRNIPSEYLIFRREDDFGFSAVDEAELTPTVNPDTLETEVIRENMTASTEMILRLESKVDQILRLYNDGKLGLDAERIKLLEDTTAKLSEVEQIIMPLLVNLMKNPEKEYIYWPNRTDKIQEQIDRILSITRGTPTE